MSETGTGTGNRHLVTSVADADDGRSRPESSGPAGTDARRTSREIQWSAYLGFLIFALIILVFSIWIPDLFLTSSTLTSILTTGAISAILALGLLIPLSAGAFDLSVAQNLGLSGIVCGWLMTKHGFSVPLAILLTLLVGLAVGLFNAFLVAIVRLDSFIATLGTTSLLLAGAVGISQGQYFGPFDSSFTSLTQGRVLGVPTICVYVLVLALAVWYLLEHTPLGRRIQATGANVEAARLAGLRTRRLIFWSMVASAFVASIAGVLYASTIGTTNQNDGPPYLLPAFTAAFLGATMLKPGMFNVWGTIIAVYLLGTGVQGLQLLGGEVWITYLFNGAALLLAVSSALISDRLRGSHAVARLLGRRSRERNQTAPSADASSTAALAGDSAPTKR
jgi:ribose transport system permease protein